MARVNSGGDGGVRVASSEVGRGGESQGAKSAAGSSIAGPNTEERRDEGDRYSTMREG